MSTDQAAVDVQAAIGRLRADSRRCVYAREHDAALNVVCDALEAAQRDVGEPEKSKSSEEDRLPYIPGADEGKET